MVNNLIETLLGRISRNYLWVLDMSCILASPRNIVARTDPMLQKLTVGSKLDGLFVEEKGVPFPIL